MKNLTVLSLGLLLAIPACGGSDDTTAAPGATACDTSVVGNICVIAGSGENGYDEGADDMALVALDARMNLPQDTLTAADGTVYILDWNNHRLRRLDAEGMLHWVAGRGELGGSLDDPENGDFNHPTNIIFDAEGKNILIAAWHNSKVRTVDLSTGKVTDLAGDGKRAYYGDEGPALTASLDLPASLAIDPDGNLVIMDQANQVLRVVDAAGNIHRMAGRCIVDAADPAGPGKCADGVEPTACPDGMNGPSGKAVCGDPAVWCAKPCTPGYGGDDGPADQIRMAQPFGQSASPAGRIVINAAGEVFFADSSNNMIRRIDKDGMVHRVAGQPPEAGVQQNGYEGDGGPALDAKLNYPVDLTFGDDGTLYFSDVFNHCIRAIDPSGNISTVAGQCGVKGSSGNGGPATAATLKLPYGVEWIDGRLNITDTGNHQVKTVKLR